METDVEAFARHIRQDGIDAARAETVRILEEARAQAAEILRQARSEADTALREARTEIESRRRSQAVELRLLARDTMLKVKEEIERVVLLLLRRPVGAALASEEVVRAAVAELARSSSPGQEWEVRVGAGIGKALAQAAVDDLFKDSTAAVTLVEEFRGSGLEFHGGSGEVLELSEESVAEVFRRLMSPELSRLLDAPPG